LFLLLGPAMAGQYAGSSACRGCHPAQFAEQSKSGHARALSRSSQHALARLFPKAPGEWAFGAGDQAVTFVSPVDREFYVEHGLTFFRSSGSMGLTPGHQSAAGVRYRLFDPSAAILRCFQCHSTGPPRLAEGSRIEPFEAGVRCESCHGPGGEHIRRQGSKAAIQNPKRLTAAALTQFCGACHRKQTAEEFPNWNDAWNVRHQPLYLVQSRCFRESSGQLSCLSCHPPHSPVVRSAEAYDEQCRRCHENVRHQNTVAAKRACAACHMPPVKLNEELKFANHWIGVYRNGNVLRPISRP
jgi:hypothetical protein